MDKIHFASKINKNTLEKLAEKTISFYSVIGTYMEPTERKSKAYDNSFIVFNGEFVATFDNNIVCSDTLFLPYKISKRLATYLLNNGFTDNRLYITASVHIEGSTSAISIDESTEVEKEFHEKYWTF